MKRFTRFALATIACLTLSVAQLAAQETTTADQKQIAGARHKRHMGARKMARMHGMKHLGQELNLTDAQKTQLKGFQEQQRTQAQAIRNNQSLTQEQKQEQFQALQQSGHEQMLSVLTPEQKTQMEQLKANRKAKMSQRKADRKEFREWKKQKESATPNPQ